MDPLVVQLHELCRAEPTRAKWVFVPGHGVGHTLGERLALSGTSWANLRFTPPLDLALRMAAPFLVEAGIDPAPDGLGPALVTRLLLDLPSTTPAYFRRLAEQPRMADVLWTAIRELRLAGLGAAEPEAFTSPDKYARQPDPRVRHPLVRPDREGRRADGSLFSTRQRVDRVLSELSQATINLRQLFTSRIGV